MTTARFLHGSDFHLGEPITNVTSPSEALRSALCDAPYRAVAKLFETAVLEEVDFVALSGNLLDPRRCGARAISHLWDQFQLCREHGVPVFWSLGAADRLAHWGEQIHWPAGVHVFSEHMPTRRMVETRVGPVLITGQAASRETINVDRFDRGAHVGPVVALGHGGFPDDYSGVAVDYWALGGQMVAETVRREPAIARYAGTPQSRHPHGHNVSTCTIVNLEGSGRASTRTVLTEEIPYRCEHVSLDEGDDLDFLAELIYDRCVKLGENASSWVLAEWSVACQKVVDRAAWSSLETALRKRIEATGCPVWVTRVHHHDELQVPGEYYDEDTILGDYLRVLRDAEHEWYVLDEYTDNASEMPEALKRLLRLDRAAERSSVLKQAAVLGAAQLGGEGEIH